MQLKEGDKAPGFSLPDGKKQRVNLKDYKGRNVLILFFPLAFTSTCEAEMCNVRDNFDKYADLDTAIVGISVDSYATLRRYGEEYGLNFPLLSDFNKETARAYGCLYEEFGPGMRGVAKRAAFVVDRTGYVRYVEVLENAGDLPNFTTIREVISRYN